MTGAALVGEGGETLDPGRYTPAAPPYASLALYFQMVKGEQKVDCSSFTHSCMCDDNHVLGGGVPDLPTPLLLLCTCNGPFGMAATVRK